MARVIWTDPALERLHQICDGQAEYSPAKAAQTRDRVFAATRHLTHSPQMGRVVPEFELEFLRELIVKPYRVLYVVRGEDCEMVSVFHSSQQLTHHFFPEDLEE